ncbi:outer membrane protein assembly factor BamD [Alteromonadaceae bacterium BrNp21-10]|nr:outer membrane protein assembly factor BamD [Alteromonadaceae bacterium BrNp21-10]
MSKKFNLYFLTAAFSALVLSACSSSPDAEKLVDERGPQTIYLDAKQRLENGNFNGAAEILSSLDSRYPFGPLSHQVQLDLIYAYYKSGKADQAMATIDRFVRLNPNHSDVDYAFYMRGLVNLDSNKNLFQEAVGINRSDRDPTPARKAFEDFRTLIEKFPESKYADDAKQRMVYIKSQLADHELSIARYYMSRQAYVAAANRGQYVLEYFSDTPQLQEALELMVECYDQLELPKLKENVLQTLKLNFPNSNVDS